MLLAYATMVTTLSTDIVGEFCVPYGVYGSQAVQKAMISSGILVTYLLPAIAMLFCYIRIVYALKYKVVA